MGGKDDAPDPPDYSGVAAASEYAADLAFKAAQGQLDWAKEQDLRNREVLDRVLNTVLPIGEETHAMAKEDRQYLIDTFRPLEQQMVEEAKTYDTQARREREAGAAASEIAQQFQLTRKASEDRLKSYGLDPSQGAFAALQAGSAIDLAAQQAGAARGARNRVEEVGRAMRADAVNLGRGLPSQIASSYGTSIESGRSAVGGATATTNAGANAFNTGVGYMGAGNQAIGNWGSTLTQGYNAQLAGFEAEQAGKTALMSGLGSIVGLGASFLGAADGGQLGAVSGLIQGKGDGSGIDDAITTTAKPGTFIVPKDVVQTVGKDKLDTMTAGESKASGTGMGVPVAVSSGEYAVSPEATRRIGKTKLQGLINAFHTSAAAQRAARG